MEIRPMPRSAVAAMCALLVGTACVMATQSIALAADGAFQLVRILGSGDVYGLDARILGAWAHQGAAVIAARAGVTDTQSLAVLLGVGQLLLPAIAWSLAIVFTRADRLVCAVVAMIAGLNAGATWFVNVSEIVLAVPLTALVAVVLWQPRRWRWYDVLVAGAAATVLVASYETALLTGAVLAVWAWWRAKRSANHAETYGCALVGTLCLASVVVAIEGIRSGNNPTHSQSLLYFVVSLEPWSFYVALAGIAAVTVGLGPWLNGTFQKIAVALGCGALLVAILGLEPGDVTAFEARGGAAVAGFLLELFLFWRWIAGRTATRERDVSEASRLLVAVPVVLIAAMVAANIQPVRDWSRSLEAFRTGVDETDGVTDVYDALPAGKRAVLWGWTSSSLSLLVRSSPDAGILVDRTPSIVPFPPSEARAQLGDEYTWGT